MNSSILWLFTVLALLMFRVHLSVSVTPAGNETDKLSLLAFKAEITNDPLGVLNSWNDSLHFCKWYGITCGRKHERVTILDLRSSKLTGSLSPHIGNLSFLRTINLFNNSFGPNIPQELGRLFRLQVLLLHNNTFAGEIPANISRCSNLISLRFSNNNLTGEIPAELGSLLNLQSFIIDLNHIGGRIPPSLGNLSPLERFSATVNGLEGPIPDGFGQLRNLKYLLAGANYLSGAIPPSMYNISALLYLSLPVNQLEGVLPPELGQNLPNLELFRINTNRFTGPIPSTVSNMSNLLVFDISSNNFTGRVPDPPNPQNLKALLIFDNNLGYGEDDDLNFLHPLVNNTSLEVLIGLNNNLGGVLPEMLSNFSTKIWKLAFGGNKIHGSIPTGIGNLIGLQAFGMEVNQLTGTIPTSIGNLQNLNVLYLSENNIWGSIPFSIGNITSLTMLHFEQNNLSGTIPASLVQCQNLFDLSLAQNNLSGTIPPEVFAIKSLTIHLDLSENQFTGPIPLEVSKLVNLGSLDISRHKLSGKLPGSLGSCTSLETLNLEENFLEGPISDSMSSLRGLRNLNLSHNNLTGQIPRFLADFKFLEHLDLSFNDFEGEVPVQGAFQNASAVSVLGNKKLCGGIPQLDLTSCPTNEPTKPKSSSKLKLIVAVACGSLGVILMASFLLSYGLRNKNVSKNASNPLQTSLLRVAYEDLRKATDGFDSTKLIGMGSFGSVYKGILRPDEIVVAVKVFNLQRKGASKSFMAEFNALSQIRHRSLVKVITACSSIDSQGNDFKALVYEFMENGSLEQWLHPDPGHQEEETPKLNLIQRLNIAIDVASALDYLHHQCQTPIIYCDLKPSNVLLDLEMTAHVGDFGLARFLPEAAQQSSSHQSSSIGIKGTIGYAAPEYGMGSELSTQGDVYSYGILLLEVFTGKRPTDGMFKDGLDLNKFPKMALPDRVTELVDPLLLPEEEETNADNVSETTNAASRDKILECLISVVSIGVSCSAELPRERMDIGDVAAELIRLKDKLLRPRMQRQTQTTNLPEGSPMHPL